MLYQCAAWALVDRQRARMNGMRVCMMMAITMIKCSIGATLSTHRDGSQGRLTNCPQTAGEPRARVPVQTTAFFVEIACRALVVALECL